MALRARLTPTVSEPPSTWPWHKAKWASINAHELLSADRRLEAETYLSSGYGLRLAIQSKRSGWVHLGRLAEVWQPHRLKGIQVSPEFGTPFLAATQVFDIRPIPRKWLSAERTTDLERRFVKPGMILVTRSGTVGRSTLALDIHENALISDDLLRVEVRDARHWGWLYAYLRAPQTRAMMRGIHYGQIIKHLEPEHLAALPVPEVGENTVEDFANRAMRILELRNHAHRLTLQAEARFEQAVGSPEFSDLGELGFAIKASRGIIGGRRRLDAAAHNPVAAKIREHMETSGRELVSITDAGYDVWVPGRYKRIPAEDGVVYWDSEDLVQVNPDLEKRYADCSFGDQYRGRVKSGWILVPSSGQVYGIIGTAVLASEVLDGQVVSNHVLRLAPRSSSAMRPGYLVTVLSHPTLGRPILKSFAFGSSVPEIAPEDVASLRVVRLGAKESEIADLAEAAEEARAEADRLEREMAADAGDMIDEFIRRPVMLRIGIDPGQV